MPPSPSIAKVVFGRTGVGHLEGYRAGFGLRLLGLMNRSPSSTSIVSEPRAAAVVVAAGSSMSHAAIDMRPTPKAIAAKKPATRASASCGPTWVGQPKNASDGRSRATERRSAAVKTRLSSEARSNETMT